jgi:hypothetical protein
MLDGVLHLLGVNTHLLFTIPAPVAYIAMSSVVLLVVLALIRRALCSKSPRRATAVRPEM